MSAKEIILRALSHLGWTALGYLIIAIPLWVITFFVLAVAYGGDSY